MLVTAYNIHSDRPDALGPRGYLRTSLAPAFRRFPDPLSGKPAQLAQPAEPATEMRLVSASPSRPLSATRCALCGVSTTSTEDDAALCADCVATELAHLEGVAS